jgi:hypothetical protein
MLNYVMESWVVTRIGHGKPLNKTYYFELSIGAFSID